MKKDDISKGIANVFANLSSDQRTRSLSTIPLTKGEVIKFTGESVTESFTNSDGEIINYGAFVTNKGNLPFSTIARNGNGLNLVAKTFETAIEEFAARLNDNYSIKVVDIKVVPSSFGNGNQRFLIFKESGLETTSGK